MGRAINEPMENRDRLPRFSPTRIMVLWDAEYLFFAED